MWAACIYVNIYRYAYVNICICIYIYVHLGKYICGYLYLYIYIGLLKGRGNGVPRDGINGLLDGGVSGVVKVQ